ncbi:MAG: glycosyltransferase [Candidatus Sumerlaeaceae bacterium]|nr:glycosyltransferase [Candidatus Sumerlaeaceae bacterium]
MVGPRQPSPLISILLPARNAQTTLSEALQSLAQQTWRNHEVIVVDDHSEDETPIVAKSWCQRDPRFRFLASRGKGLIAALQTAHAAAQGDFVGRMDADDISHPMRLARQMEVLLRDDAVGLCATHVCDLDCMGEGRRVYTRWLNTIRSHEDVVRNLFVECPLAHPTFLLPRQVFDSVGGYRDVLWPEDYDLVFRLWLAGWKFAVVSQPLLSWRDRPNRLSRTHTRYSENAFRECKFYFLLRSPYFETGRPLVQWGAGKEGKWWLRRWPDQYRPLAVVDVDPRKIGQRIYGVPVISPENLGAPEGRFLIVTVGVRGAREEIRDFLGRRGWYELQDYIFVR